MVSNIYTDSSEFSVDMTTEMLCTWLRKNKLKDKHIDLLVGEGSKLCMFSYQNVLLFIVCKY